MINWCIQKIPIKLIKENKRNPRKIDKHAVYHLEKTIDTFGLIDKPILNTDYTLIGGHQRVRILKKKKVAHVECWIPDRELTEQEVENLCINLNLHRGDWDWEMLANEFDPVNLLEYGFTEQQLLGADKEVQKILEQEQKQETKKEQKTCPNCGCVV